MTHISYIVSGMTEDGWINLSVSYGAGEETVYNGGIALTGLKKVMYNIGIFSTSVQNVSLEVHEMNDSGWDNTIIYDRELCQVGYHFFTGVLPVDFVSGRYLKFHFYSDRDVSNINVLNNWQEGRVFVTN